jgi:hypothetical protein
MKAASQFDLHLQAQANILMREDRTRPFLTLYSFARRPSESRSYSFAIRTAEGKISKEYRQARSEIALTTAD